MKTQQSRTRRTKYSPVIARKFAHLLKITENDRDENSTIPNPTNEIFAGYREEICSFAKNHGKSIFIPPSSLLLPRRIASCDCFQFPVFISSYSTTVMKTQQSRTRRTKYSPVIARKFAHLLKITENDRDENSTIPNPTNEIFAGYREEICSFAKNHGKSIFIPPSSLLLPRRIASCEMLRM
ncbi:hypothetical protein QE152_g34862 [Popillia japonica]|uniref:Uncharacterized protein n=1 Tax=Popillia japonica TaxID=7064 RepID=A0AAW1ISE1_POPJA